MSGTRPIDAATGEEMDPMAQPGYYPGFHTMDQEAFWDAATRAVIVDRVDNVPPLRFFQGDEARLMQAVLDRVMPQDDRDQEHRIPVMHYIDKRLFEGKIDGYRYHDMPPDGEAYHLGLRGIDAEAQERYGKGFVDLGPEQQDEVLWDLHRADPQGGADIWAQVPVDRFWILLMSDAADGYYCHPYAWDEVGFGGPAYPRGYFRLERGQPEPWEVREHRYEWSAPSTSLSDRYQQLGGRHPHRAPAGQEGTH